MADDDSPDSASDFAACAPTSASYLAAAVFVFSGVAFLFLGAQTYAMTRSSTLTLSHVAVMLASGAALVFLGAKQLSVRAWVSVAGAAVAVLTGFFASWWLYLSVRHGLFSFLATGLPFLCAASATLSLLAIRTARRADAARRRMLARGETFGV
jgi:hypothetical protein